MNARQTIRRLLLATILAAGFGTVWTLATVWAGQVVYQATTSAADVEMLLLRRDGTPVVQYFLGGRYDNWRYRDLAGHPLDVPDNEAWLHTLFLSAGSGGAGATAPWNQRIESFTDNGHPARYWFFISDGRPQGHAYLVGYDSVTNARIGFLTPAGFRADAPPTVDQFPFNGEASWGLNTRVASAQQHPFGPRYPYRVYAPPGPGGASPWVLYVQTTDQKVYAADIAQRTVRVLFTEPALRSIGMLMVMTPSAGATHHLAVRLDDRLQLRDAAGAVAREFRIPEELRGRPFSWAATAGGGSVFQTTTLPDQISGETVHHLTWADADGRVTRREEIRLHAGRPAAAVRLLAAGALPAPAVLDPAVIIVRPSQLMEERHAASWSEALSRALAEFWPALVLGQLVGLGLAVACYRRQVLYGAAGAGRLLWPAFVFLGGLFGWVGYRYGRSWPPLARCPECGRVVPQDRIDCAVCHAGFPVPELKGTEIYA